MEKSVVLRDGSVLQIFRPRGENAAEILEYLKTIGGETHFLLMDENGLGISEEEERLILEENLKQERGGVYGGRGTIFAEENLIFQSKNRFLAVFAPGNLKDFSKNW